MKSSYDVIVVGGGPGGSWAAKYAAENGVSVLLLEKDRDIGTPVRCAEGVSEEGLRRLITVKERWISQTIRSARLVSPDGTFIDINTGGLGFVLNRKVFDYDLAAMAAEAGAHLLTKAYVHSLIRTSGVVSGVEMTHLGRNIKISGSVVIGADGVESRVGRWAGLETRTPVEDMVSSVQMTLTCIDIDPEVVQFYFGKHVAPGGYLWVFPKGERSANVGLGISGLYSGEKKPLDYLNRFINKHFLNASVLSTVAGGVPTDSTLKKITADGIMLVGDAAHQINPLTGGGILYAMVAGKIAGTVAADAVKAGDISEKKLSIYNRKWLKAEGKNNERCYKIKKVVNRFSDDELNKIALLLKDIPQEKRTVFQIIKAALLHHPKLILEAAKVFA